MNLQTIVDVEAPGFTLNFKDKGLFVGSCFATSLQSYLSFRLANVKLCPYGEMYNPVSLSSFFLKSKFTEDDVIQSKDGLWYSWYHHGSVYSVDKESILEKINSSVPSFDGLDYVVITLGTSWVYQLSDGRVVSNCHKMPSSLFSRRCLQLDEIVSEMEKVILSFPTVRFILTVSPIRHIKDGLPENSYSKSLLRVAAGILQKINSNVYYFPSYEIMNDELRDYRFYKEDMLHPTEQASSYIMDKFVNISFDSVSRDFFSDVLKLRNVFNHHPLHPESDSYLKFLKYRNNLLAEISKRYPDVEFNNLSFGENV